MPYSSYSREAEDEFYDTYAERQRSRNYDRRRPQSVSYSELGRIRSRELGSMQQLRSDRDIDTVRRSRTQDDESYNYSSDARNGRSTSRRDRYTDDRYDYRRSRRPNSTSDYGRGDYDSRDYGRLDYGRKDYDRGDSRQRNGRSVRGSQDNDQQVAPYQRQQRQQDQNQGQSQDDSNEDGEEKRGNKFFDKGSDGFVSAATGAALGAITARHFLGPKEFSKEESSKRGRIQKNWKAIGGAVVGAVALNMASNQFKAYFEEMEDDDKEGIENGAEMMQETLAAVGPDVL